MVMEVVAAADGSQEVSYEGVGIATGAMSEEQLKAFMEAVKADAGLQEKLRGATDADSVLAIAEEAGFMISADELQRAEAVGEGLSDRELEGVAGGESSYWVGTCGDCPVTVSCLDC